MGSDMEANVEDAQRLLQARGHAGRRRYETEGLGVAMIGQMPAAMVKFLPILFPVAPPPERKSGHQLFQTGSEKRSAFGNSVVQIHKQWRTVFRPPPFFALAVF